MQYMLMFYENEAEVADQRDAPGRTGPYWDAWNAYMGALYPTGIVLRGDPLLPPSAATTVRLDGGNRMERVLLDEVWRGRKDGAINCES